MGLEEPPKILSPMEEKIGVEKARKIKKDVEEFRKRYEPIKKFREQMTEKRRELMEQQLEKEKDSPFKEERKEFAEFYKSERFDDILNTIREMEEKMRKSKFKRISWADVSDVLEKKHFVNTDVLISGGANDPMMAKRQETASAFFDAYPEELIDKILEDYKDYKKAFLRE